MGSDGGRRRAFSRGWGGHSRAEHSALRQLSAIPAILESAAASARRTGQPYGPLATQPTGVCVTPKRRQHDRLPSRPPRRRPLHQGSRPSPRSWARAPRPHPRARPRPTQPTHHRPAPTGPRTHRLCRPPTPRRQKLDQTVNIRLGKPSLGPRGYPCRTAGRQVGDHQCRTFAGGHVEVQGASMRFPCHGVNARGGVTGWPSWG